MKCKVYICPRSRRFGEYCPDHKHLDMSEEGFQRDLADAKTAWATATKAAEPVRQIKLTELADKWGERGGAFVGFVKPKRKAAAPRVRKSKTADIIDGYNRDDLGPSPD